MDFTINRYHRLLNTLRNQGFSFVNLKDNLHFPLSRSIIIRHDVDMLPENSLEFARLQNAIGIKGTYYFRAVPESWNEKIIKEVANLGHEIGYHYEDLGATAQRIKGTKAQWHKDSIGNRLRDLETNGRRDNIHGPQDRKTARPQDHRHLEKELVNITIVSFSENLEKLRKIAPVKTICMHGSPMSRWDSRLLWKYYDYRDFGIIGEPYFDINFDEVLYLTDTGRRWDSDAVSVRDKVMGQGEGEKRRRGEWAKSNPFENWKVKPFKYRENNSSSPLHPLTPSPHLPLPPPPPRPPPPAG